MTPSDEVLTKNQLIIANAMSETELQNNVIDLATRLGYLVHAERPGKTSRFRRNKKGQLVPVWVTPIQGKEGFPDLVLAHPNQQIQIIYFVELKSQKGKLSPAQEAWLGALPPVCQVWRPSDWLDGTIERELSYGIKIREV